MKLVYGKAFLEAMQALTKKGGPYAKAAAQFMGIMARAQTKTRASEIFMGLTTTNNGESRIRHCVKYDLQGSCRLITVQHNDLCFALFIGTHDDCHEWLETNKGKRFHLQEVESKTVLGSTRMSDDIKDPVKRLNTIPDFSSDPLWLKLSENHFAVLCEDMSPQMIERLKLLTSIVDDGELLDIAVTVKRSTQTDLIFDTFELLRSGSVHEAKLRIELYLGQVRPIEESSVQETKLVSSGDEFLINDDIDPVLFEHFLKTSSFQSWMLYLHPSQREFVKRDFNGPAKLSGVSGSGKTSVLIHRAIRLAREFPAERILVITLNRALATMIKDLIAISTGGNAPNNLEIFSFWKLCFDNLIKFEPDNKHAYSDRIDQSNLVSPGKHIDDIWAEYYECRNGYDKAKVLAPLHKTLLVRNIYPADYIRQEFDYLRSVLGPRERDQYATLEREGRSVPLEERYRLNVIDGLASWEEKMELAGAVNYLGLATALYKNIEKLKPVYRCVLVDEMQDFGCIELKIVRALTKVGSNDIFLCGDLAQSVLTKFHKMSDCGIDVNGRSFALKQNYRNSREILTVAFSLFENNKDLFVSAANIEILPPEYANFSSSPPLLLSAIDFQSELSYALGYLQSLANTEAGRNKKFCIAVCGYNQSEIDHLAIQLSLKALTGDTDVVAGQIFLSDLEQTKGFEFDSVIIVNCSLNVVPHLALPREESYRDLCKLYVAMTRAKTELIISYVGISSPFLQASLSKFTCGDWQEYAKPIFIADFKPAVPHFVLNYSHDHRQLTAQAILYLPQAVGLSAAAQEKLIQLVTGTLRYQDRRPIEWRNFGEFFNDIKRTATLRTSTNISAQVWAEFEVLNSKLLGTDEGYK